MSKPELTVEEVAKRMGCSQQKVRIGIQRGKYTFGVAFKLGGEKNFTYTIYPEKFYELYGQGEAS